MSETRIMIVEDEGIVALDLQNRLLRMGYSVPVVTAYGEEAFRRAGEVALDLILMDIRLRGSIDGIEASRGIREMEDIPIIYLTAFGDEETLERARGTAPYGYITKPFDDRQLFTTIEMALFRHHLEKKLRESQRWLSTILNSIGDAVIAMDTQGVILFLNAYAAALTGWKQEAAVGKEIGSVFRPVDEKTRLPVEIPIARVIGEGLLVSLPEQHILTAPEGRDICIDDTWAPIKDGRGTVLGCVLVFRDSTARRRKDEALRKSEFRFRNIIAQMTIGVALFDCDGRVVEANPVIIDLLGVNGLSELVGLSLFDDHTLTEELRTRLQAGETVNYQYCVDYDSVPVDHLFQKKRSGQQHLDFVISPWLGEEGTRDGYLLQVQDITTRKLVEERILHDARHDALTGLPNRVHFLDQLERAIRTSRRRSDSLVAVLFLDLDHFKEVNDNLGHAAGDQVLVIISQRLKSCLRPGDVIARFGGDEFAIALENIQSLADATAVAKRVLSEVAAPISMAGRVFNVSVSIGIAMSSLGQMKPEELLRAADVALYHAKNSGKARYAVFEG